MEGEEIWCIQVQNCFGWLTLKLVQVGLIIFCLTYEKAFLGVGENEAED